MRAQLRDSPFESAHVSIHKYCTLFPPNKYFICFTTSFVEIPFCKASGPEPLSLTTDLMARLGAFIAVTQPRSLAGNPGPASSHCRLRPPESNYKSDGTDNQF